MAEINHKILTSRACLFESGFDFYIVLMSIISTKSKTQYFHTFHHKGITSFEECWY